MIRILLSTRLDERRMTQSDLARVTGICSQTINELYHDFAERVNLDDLDLICEALDCDLEHLICGQSSDATEGKGELHRLSYIRYILRVDIGTPAVIAANAHLLAHSTDDRVMDRGQLVGMLQSQNCRWKLRYSDSEGRQHSLLSPLDCPPARTGGAVNGGRIPVHLDR